MTPFDPLADLDPAAYAPFRDPRDYILSWTDQIWIDKGLGRLGEHYADDIKVHTAYGETYDFDHVLTNSVQKMSAFPNGGGGSGEDVVWEQRGPMGFVSSHRVLKTGTNLGHWTYGPPTGRNWVSRTIAHCVVQDGKVVEEWLVRDEYAVLQSLGIDPERGRRRSGAGIAGDRHGDGDRQRCRPLCRALSRSDARGRVGAPARAVRRSVPLDRGDVRRGLEQAPL